MHTNALTPAKSVLAVQWEEGEHFDVPCKQLPSSEPRVLQTYTILITPYLEEIELEAVNQ